MIDTKLLRQKLIDIAMRGLLVEQRQEEGNASDLLEQIRAKKAALIKKGQIKKEKPLPEIKEEEKPFTIPANWCWVRLGEIVNKNIKRGKSPIYAENGTTLVFAQKCNTKSGNIDLSLAKYLESASLPKYPLEEFMQNGDIAINSTGRGTIGRVGIIKNIDVRLSIVPDSHITVVRVGNFVFPEYLFYCLLSQQTFFESAGDGSTNQVELKTSVVQNVVVPLPPLAEQKRIVAALEASLKLVDTIAKDSVDLDKALKFLRQKVLDMAMRGLLVEQRPEDGNATDLLEQIRAEKVALIKKGQIKKEKPLPEIKEEEKPFAIPDSWCWVRLGEIGSWAAGATPSRGFADYYKGNIPWLKTGDLNDGYIYTVPEFISNLALQDCSLKLNPAGSILIAMYGATIGKLGILRVPMTTNQACCACIPFNGLFNLYLFYCLMANKAKFISQGAGGAQPNISKEKILRFPIPLPPLAEQKRIVAKLEQINALIETALN